MITSGAQRSEHDAAVRVGFEALQRDFSRFEGVATLISGCLPAFFLAHDRGEVEHFRLSSSIFSSVTICKTYGPLGEEWKDPRIEKTR